MAKRGRQKVAIAVLCRKCNKKFFREHNEHLCYDCWCASHYRRDTPEWSKKLSKSKALAESRIRALISLGKEHKNINVLFGSKPVGRSKANG